jgi:hypothetical protein
MCGILNPYMVLDFSLEGNSTQFLKQINFTLIIIIITTTTISYTGRTLSNLLKICMKLWLVKK